jgi:protein ImuB
VIVAADAAAVRAGLRDGMPATQAQALVADLIIQDADPQADARDLERLALWALHRYAPVVAVDLPDGLIIDTTGSDHLHGGEQAMLNDLVRRLIDAGIVARAAIADTWGAAHAVARYGEYPLTIVTAVETPAALASLPIAALRLASGLVATLRTLGFERIADLTAQPRAPFALRFGPEIGRRLDQAFGRLAEPIEPLRPADMIEVERAFAEPIGAPETIARYTGMLVAVLCKALEAQGLGVRRLDLLFELVDNRVEVIRAGTSQPVRDVKRLTRLLCDRIDRIEPGFGIERMRLAATLAEPLEARQSHTSLVDDDVPDVSDLVDVLSNRVGAQALYRVAPVASDVPERSVRRIAPTAPDAGTWPDDWPRPSRLLPTPELIETIAVLPDHPPATFTWRGVRRRVKRADGPERVFGEWWKRDAELVAVRDYFRVEDETGERYWIFRAGDGEDTTTGSHRWYLHGIFG